MNTRTWLAVGVSAFFLAVAPEARAQDDFVSLIRRGDYEGLAKKLRANLDLDKADPKLRFYLAEEPRVTRARR